MFFQPYHNTNEILNLQIVTNRIFHNCIITMTTRREQTLAVAMVFLMFNMRMKQQIAMIWGILAAM